MWFQNSTSALRLFQEELSGCFQFSKLKQKKKQSSILTVVLPNNFTIKKAFFTQKTFFCIKNVFPRFFMKKIKQSQIILLTKTET